MRITTARTSPVAWIRLLFTATGIASLMGVSSPLCSSQSCCVAVAIAYSYRYSMTPSTYIRLWSTYVYIMLSNTQHSTTDTTYNRPIFTEPDGTTVESTDPGCVPRNGMLQFFSFLNEHIACIEQNQMQWSRFCCRHGKLSLWRVF